MMVSASASKYSYTQNRELSWLRFNERVLEEAIDPNVPPYERLKFVSIFTSNLDEFYMIRVGSLTDISLIKAEAIDSKSGLTPKEQLARIHRATHRLIRRKDAIYRNVNETLLADGYGNVKPESLSGSEAKRLANYFQTFVRPVLSPQIIGTHHPFPHMENLQLHIGVRLKLEGEIIFGILPVPKMLPRVWFTDDTNMRFLLMEDILLHYANLVFDRFQLLDKSILCVTRNADINTEEGLLDEDIDYRMYMKKILKKRARLAPVRMEHSSGMSEDTRTFFRKQLGLSADNTFALDSPLNMGYVFALESQLPPSMARAYLYPPHKPQNVVALPNQKRMLDRIQENDLLLHYPYEDIDLFLQAIREASQDPHVISIHITIYRLARNSKLVDYLTQAAEAGKDVIVLMELRARFDEENNINWSETLIEAGCKVFYGFDDYKAHSKLCLITSIRDNKLHYITQIGTGNYNETTSHLYTDLSLLTADQIIGADASSFFQNMLIGRLDGRYEKLLAAPVTLKEGVLERIDEQIRRARDGKPAALQFKLNSITDRDLIDKLAEASQAGVRIRMIVRGICCLLPGVPGATENIEIRSIVGRFLEHTRLYVFGEGDDIEVYLSSADFMTRNTEKRVEIAAPIEDPECRRKALEMLDLQWRDNTKARRMQPDGTYLPLDTEEDPFNAQDAEIELALRRKEAKESLEAKPKAKPAVYAPPQEAIPPAERNFWDRILAWFRRSDS